MYPLTSRKYISKLDIRHKHLKFIRGTCFLYCSPLFLLQKKSLKNDKFSGFFTSERNFSGYFQGVYTHFQKTGS